MDTKNYFKNYEIPRRSLQKFRKNELEMLSGICQECDINPTHIMNYPRHARKLLAFPPDKKATQQLFCDPYALLFYLQLFHKPVTSPFNYLKLSYEHYLSSQKKIVQLELPDDKKDSCVKPVLGSFFDAIHSRKQQLGPLDVAGLLYGSLLFGDPRVAPDIDFDFIYYNEEHNPENILAEIIRGLRKKSLVRLDCEALNLDSYRESLEQLRKGNYGYFFEQETSEEIISDLGVLLTGKPIYFDFCDNALVQGRMQFLRAGANRVAQQNPLVRALLTHQLEKVVESRALGDRPVYTK